MKTCITCGLLFPLDGFAKDAQRPDGHQNYCKLCKRKYNSQRHHEMPIKKRMYNRAKARALKKGLDFTITPSDITIPSHCPVLGCLLDVGNKSTKPNSPSLDRIYPELGYIRGNIRVISQRANLLKNNATLEEMTLVLDDLWNIQRLCPVR